MTRALELARELIRRRSVTPEDAGCQDLLSERLAALGFEIERLPFGRVSNLWARLGSTAPLLVFAGHTDVVPPGPETEWQNPPFEPLVRDDHLYGRGAADMKSSLAAMVAAVEELLGAKPALEGSIAFLITSDEEGDAVDGTARVIESLGRRGIAIDHCIVGEPSSSARTADVVRNGRRGSLNGTLRVRGIQGHVAYPEQVRNPIHSVAPALAELTARRWDEGNEYFPPSSFQISNVHAGTGAGNVVPGELEARFNFRFNSEQTPEGLQGSVRECLERHEVEHELSWQLSGMPYLTPAGRLTEVVGEAVEAVMGHRPALSTSGGTSDGRFIAPSGAQVVELGTVNETIHKIDERIAVIEIERLTAIYRRIMALLLTGREPAGSL